jgi:hypothetical protein
MANIVIANALMPDGSKNIRIVYNTDTDRFSMLDDSGDSIAINTETEPTYLEVNITSEQILSMGTSPIELLPAPGEGKYYDCRVVLEYTFNNVDYSVTDDIMIGFDGYGAVQLIRYLLDGFNVNTVAIWNGAGTAIERSIAYASFYTAYSMQVNKSVVFTTLDATNPTNGDGTVKAKIWYTIKNFG